jgi:hypothetical protein
MVREVVVANTGGLLDFGLGAIFYANLMAAGLRWC